MATKSRCSEASPVTKRESRQEPKYSLMVGTITTRAVKASDSLGVQPWAVVSMLFAVAPS